MFKAFLTVILSGFTILSSQVYAEELPTIKITMLMEHEGFLMWYAKQNDFDKTVGINIDLTILDTNGIDMMNRHRVNPDSWNVTCVTSIPLIVGSNNMPLEVVGIANDESTTTGIYVSPENAIMRVKGWNSEYPDVYGSPETIRGKTFAMKNLTSSAYVVSKYLEIFNMDFSDIKIKDMSGKESIDALMNKKVDGIAVWSPDTYLAEKEGMELVSTAESVDAEIPLMFMVDRDYALENEDTVGRMLAAYLMAVDKQIENPKSLVKDYQKFLKKFSGNDFTKEFCEYDILRHTVVPLETQLKLFERKGKGKSSIQKLEATLASSLMLILYDSAESDFCTTAKNIKNPRYVTDKYLKIARRVLKNIDN